MNHLTAVGLGLGAMPSAVEEIEKNVECVNCGRGELFSGHDYGVVEKVSCRVDGIAARLMQTFFLVRVGAIAVSLTQMFLFQQFV